MPTAIRPLEDRDHESVVALSLRAWAPVFASLERILGPSGVYAALHPDWRVSQRRAVQAALDAEDVHVWVAEADAVVAGFAAAVLHHDESIGEVHGIATALLVVATTWIAEQGRAVALVGTGGDPGHAPARRTYEKAGFTALPGVQYFRTL